MLGRKGTKGMDRVTGLAVAAVGPLAAGYDTALVLGTSGSVRSMMAFTRSERPFAVDPAVIPSVVMNCAAGQCAIWNGLTGPNATIAGGRAAGLRGLSYARRLLRAGRARAVLCGAAEEYSAERSWLAYYGAVAGGPGQYGAVAGGPGQYGAVAGGPGQYGMVAGGPGHYGTALGEGAAMLRLEPSGAPGALATVLAVEERVAGGSTTVRCAINRVGVAAGQVWAVIADSGAATGVFGMAALALAAGESGPRIAVVCCADPAGAVAAAVPRLNGGG